MGKGEDKRFVHTSMDMERMLLQCGGGGERKKKKKKGPANSYFTSFIEKEKGGRKKKQSWAEGKKSRNLKRTAGSFCTIKRKKGKEGKRKGQGNFFSTN